MRVSRDLLKVLDSARSRAVVVGHPRVTPSHLLAALLDEPGIRTAIEQAGGSPSELGNLVAADLQDVSDPSFLERVVSRVIGRHRIVESGSFRRTLRTASRHIRRASLAEVGAVDVLAALFSDSHTAGLLKAAGLTRLALLRYHCHGIQRTGRSGAELEDAPECDIVIFNDHYTEMETVVRILEKAFGMSSSRAFKTMVRVHADGQASVGPFAAADAAEILRVAQELAEANEAPLRLELRAAQE